MKKTSVFIFLWAFCSLFYLQAAGETSIIKEILTQHVNEKVGRMQVLIPLSDPQAAAVRTVELDFLLDVQKIEQSYCPAKRKRMQKLILRKEEKLKKILDMEGFLRYDAIEKGRITPREIRANH